MSVLDCQWGDKGCKLHQEGKLVLFLEDQNILLFTLDDVNNDTLYSMRWGAVMKYADGEASSYANYYIPTVPILPPAMDGGRDSQKEICPNKT